MKAFFFAALAVILSLAVPAMAQDTIVRAEPTISFLLPYVQATVLAFIGVAVPIVVQAFVRKTNIQISDSQRDSLQTSLQNAAGLLLAKTAELGKDLNFDVRSPIMAEAIRYVQDGSPDVVAKYDLTPAKIAEKIVAKVPQVTVAPEPIAAPLTRA